MPAGFIDDIIANSGIGECLGIPSYIFPEGPGFGPIIKGAIGANVAPAIELCSAIDPLLPNPVTAFPDLALEGGEVYEKILALPADFPVALPGYILSGFVVDVPNTPAIPIPGFGTLGGELVVPDATIPSLTDFIVGLLEIPLKFFTDIAKAMTPPFDIPVPTLDGFVDLVSGLPVFPPDYIASFAECLAKALFMTAVGIFETVLPFVPL